MGWGKRETRKKAESVRMTGREIQCSREPKHVPAEGAPRPSRGYHGPRRLCCAGSRARPTEKETAYRGRLPSWPPAPLPSPAAEGSSRRSEGDHAALARERGCAEPRDGGRGEKIRKTRGCFRSSRDEGGRPVTRGAARA